MTAGSIISEEREFNSGDVVEPGYYLDVETGAVVQVREKDELPTGSRTVQYRRRFRRVSPESVKSAVRRRVRGR